MQFHKIEISYGERPIIRSERFRDRGLLNHSENELFGKLNQVNCEEIVRNVMSRTNFVLKYNSQDNLLTVVPLFVMSKIAPINLSLIAYTKYFVTPLCSKAEQMCQR